eukprot:6173306-Pleurochrysis_carterae.AAC.3
MWRFAGIAALVIRSACDAEGIKVPTTTDRCSKQTWEQAEAACKDLELELCTASELRVQLDGLSPCAGPVWMLEDCLLDGEDAMEPGHLTVSNSSLSCLGQTEAHLWCCGPCEGCVPPAPPKVANAAVHDRISASSDSKRAFAGSGGVLQAAAGAKDVLMQTAAHVVRADRQQALIDLTLVFVGVSLAMMIVCLGCFAYHFCSLGQMVGLGSNKRVAHTKVPVEDEEWRDEMQVEESQDEMYRDQQPEDENHSGMHGHAAGFASANNDSSHKERFLRDVQPSSRVGTYLE